MVGWAAAGWAAVEQAAAAAAAVGGLREASTEAAMGAVATMAEGLADMAVESEALAVAARVASQHTIWAPRWWTIYHPMTGVYGRW